MIPEKLCQTPELDSYHRDISPGFGTGFGCFVIAHRAAVTHQPAKGALYYPSSGQDLESARIVGSLHYLYFQFRTESFDPLSKCVSGIAAIDPEQAQPGKPTQGACQQAL